MKVLGLNANSLMVDPKIIRMDERFRNESDEAEEVFSGMDEEDRTKMQENFVKACGGKILKEGEARAPRERAGRMKKESTFEATKELVVKGLPVRDIARERKMALSTIWGHIEKLSAEGGLTREQHRSLIPQSVDWEAVYSDLSAAMEKEGTEKLKPIYEACGEKYDYDLVRLGRLLFTLK